jgi:hypothetical protein
VFDKMPKRASSAQRFKKPLMNKENMLMAAKQAAPILSPDSNFLLAHPDAYFLAPGLNALGNFPPCDIMETPLSRPRPACAELSSSL